MDVTCRPIIVLSGYPLWPIGYDAWLLYVSVQVRVTAGSPQVGWPGCFINVHCCEGLSLVLLQL